MAKEFNIYKSTENVLKYFNVTLIIIGIFAGIVLYFYKSEFTQILIKHNLLTVFLLSICGIFLCTIGLLTIKYILSKKKYLERLKELEITRKNYIDLINPDRQYERLGVEILCLEIGTGLLSIADPNQKNELIPKLTAKRQKIGDVLGYVFPICRITDSARILKYEYQISVRHQVVGSGTVYPDKYVVFANEWDSKVDKLPENIITDIDIKSQTQCYWLDKDFVNIHPEITFFTASEIILDHLEEIVIEYVDEIMTTCDIEKYIERVSKEENSTCLIEKLKERLDYEDIRKVFVNLIKENYSIRDIMFVFDRLCDYSRTTKDTNELAELLKADLDFKNKDK